MRVSQTRQRVYWAEVISQETYPYIVSIIKDQENEVIAQGEWYYNRVNGFNYLEYVNAGKPVEKRILPYPPSLIEGQLMYMVLNFLEEYVELTSSNAIHFFIEREGKLTKTPGMLFSYSWFTEETYLSIMKKLVLQQKEKLTEFRKITNLNTLYPRFNQHLSGVTSVKRYVFFDSLHHIAFVFHDEKNTKQHRVLIEKYFQDKQGRIILSTFTPTLFKVQDTIITKTAIDFKEFYDAVIKTINYGEEKQHDSIYVLPEGNEEFKAFMSMYYEDDILPMF